MDNYKEKTLLSLLTLTLVFGAGDASAKEDPGSFGMEKIFQATSTQENNVDWAEVDSAGRKIFVSLINHDNKDEGGHCHHNNSNDGEACPSAVAPKFSV